MKLFLAAWALVSVSFVLGWGIHSAMVATRDSSEASPSPSRRKRFGLPVLFTTLAGRLAFGGVVLAAVGGLAAVGSLPRPVQNVVSAAAERVGLEIPSGNENDTLRLASPSASRVPHVHRRVLSVIDNWEGEKDCEYLQALARAAGASPPPACPRASGGEHETASEPRAASSDEINEQPSAEPHPAPPIEPSPTPTPTETPSTEPSPAETPPADPPPDEGPLVDPPPDESPSGEPPP